MRQQQPGGLPDVVYQVATGKTRGAQVARHGARNGQRVRRLGCRRHVDAPGRLQLRQHGGHLALGQAQGDQVVGRGQPVAHGGQHIPLTCNARLEHQFRIHAKAAKSPVWLRLACRALPLHQGGQEVGRPALARRRTLLAARQGQGLQPLPGLPGLLVGPLGQLHGVHRWLLAHRRAALPSQQGHQGPQPLHLGHQRAMRRQAPGALALQQPTQRDQGLARVAGHGSTPHVGQQFVQSAVQALVLQVLGGQCGVQGVPSWRGSVGRQQAAMDTGRQATGHGRPVVWHMPHAPVQMACNT